MQLKKRIDQPIKDSAIKRAKRELAFLKAIGTVADIYEVLRQVPAKKRLRLLRCAAEFYGIEIPG